MKEGPLKSAFETDTKGVLYQELITYKIIHSMLTKETVTRTFQKDGNYIDSVSHRPLCEAMVATLEDVVKRRKQVEN
tara:strand:- start:108 stop:338 length:231 start_codon:yes stop_codon:yes gene_type:complete